MCTGSFKDYTEFLTKSVIIVSFRGRTAGEECCYIRSRSEEENHTNGEASISTCFASVELTRVAGIDSAVLEDSHEGVREADFGSVNRPIPGCFDESEYFGITRVE